MYWVGILRSPNMLEIDGYTAEADVRDDLEAGWERKSISKFDCHQYTLGWKVRFIASPYYESRYPITR